MSELGPISQAILDYVQEQPDYIRMFEMIRSVAQKTGVSHSSKWYFRQLLGLALEKRIECKLYRSGDKLTFKFRRLHDEAFGGLEKIDEEPA